MSSKIIESKVFLNYDDAEEFLEQQLERFKELDDGWVIEEASIRYINGGWFAGVLFGKGQLELDF
jgi:hypothetical protein